MKKSFALLSLLLVLFATSAMGSTIKVVSGHDDSPIRGAQVVIAFNGLDNEYMTNMDGEIKLPDKLSYNSELFIKKKKFFRRFISLKRRRGVKVDFDNYKIEMFKKHNEDGIFIVTPGGYEEINYNPVEQEGEEITELFITGTPTIINSGSNLKIVENNMDDAHMIHKAEKGLFAFDPPDEENQFSIGKYKPSRINEFVTLHTPDLQDGFYVIFPEIYSKYAMDDAFFFRIKK